MSIEKSLGANIPSCVITVECRTSRVKEPSMDHEQATISVMETAYHT